MLKSLNSLLTASLKICARMASLELVLPIYWQQTSSKTVLVGMNAYRNWHYHTSNNFKKEFTQLVASQLDSCIISSPYKLEMRLFYKNPNCDASNVVALIEKVVLDALQTSNIIEDDTVKHHLGSSWTVVSQDKTNPRCEITIKEL